VVDKIVSGESILEVVNYFEFLSLGMKDVRVIGPETRVDLEVNDLRLDQQVSIKAPHFHPDFVLFGIAAVEQNDFLMPTDLKLFRSGQSLRLKTVTNESRYKIFILSKKDEALFKTEGWRDLFKRDPSGRAFAGQFFQ